MRTLEHVLDEDAALGDLLVDDELFIVRCDEENHDVTFGLDGGRYRDTTLRSRRWRSTAAANKGHISVEGADISS